MLRSIKDMDTTDMKPIVAKAKAVVDHMFSDHKRCDDTWCTF